MAFIGIQFYTIDFLQESIIVTDYITFKNNAIVEISVDFIFTVSALILLFVSTEVNVILFYLFISLFIITYSAPLKIRFFIFKDGLSVIDAPLCHFIN